jgi:pyrroloquinoline-quinone synthase
MTCVAEYYLDAIDVQIDRQHLLKHPFYQAWSCGMLTKECLREYAVEYYRHVNAFPTYLSALHAHTVDPETRRHLLQNLIDEEAGHPNHPELWRSFATELGATDEELDTTKAFPAIDRLINTFRTICHEQGVAEGLAALYAYESQIPAVSISKIDGLCRHYNMTEAKQWEYFTVHIAADEEHAAIERQLLSQYVTADNAQQVQQAVQAVLDDLYNFLSSLCERYQIAA